MIRNFPSSGPADGACFSAAVGGTATSAVAFAVGLVTLLKRPASQPSPRQTSPANSATAANLQAVIPKAGFTDVTVLDNFMYGQPSLLDCCHDERLTIVRGDQAPFDVTITRATITIPSVESKMLDNNIAYIKITVFGDNIRRLFGVRGDYDQFTVHPEPQPTDTKCGCAFRHFDVNEAY